ncbi:MAG TPA: hypothetical protein VNW97_12320 [Candidatus Saccharimonadales bacterium]|nr:hypothetical protein [Candidatus Saccharimonadales bacterium]
MRFGELSLDRLCCIYLQVADLAEMLFNILNKFKQETSLKKRIQGKLSATRPRGQVLNEFGGKRVSFPKMKGRTVDEIELNTSAEHHSIAVRFADQTELRLVLETGFTIRAEHMDMKSGNSRLLQRWPEISNER